MSGSRPPTDDGQQPPLLEVRGLRTHIDTPSGRITPVDGVDISLESGETIGVVGESGSGKSMMVRSIMGIAPTTASVDPPSSVRSWRRALLGLSLRESCRIVGRETAMFSQYPCTSLRPIGTIVRQTSGLLPRQLGLGRNQARDRTLDLLFRVRFPYPRAFLTE